MATTRLSTRDAHEYLHTVRDTFQDKREIYDAFLNVMKDFKANRISHSLVRAKVKDLFKGHRDLILAFNKFLPECYKITFPSGETTQNVPEYGEAVDFINRVKTRLQDDRANQYFLYILEMCCQGKISVDEVYHEVFNGLFRYQHDLRVEFAYFLPRHKIIEKGESSI